MKLSRQGGHSCRKKPVLSVAALTRSLCCDSLGGIALARITMYHPTLVTAIAFLASATSPATAQHPSPADSGIAQSSGHWVASGVTFQSGRSAHPFAVDVRRIGNQIEARLPAELALSGGNTYLLSPVGHGVFRHVDAVGRVVEFALKSAHTATLVVTASGGDGRVTWQLTRG